MEPAEITNQRTKKQICNYRVQDQKDNDTGVRTFSLILFRTRIVVNHIQNELAPTSSDGREQEIIEIKT